MDEIKQNLSRPDIDGTLPHQIEAPDFKRAGMEMKAPFINRFGVVIGDSYYSSLESPLENWTDETDPETMAGDEWVHPTNDIGWNTSENKVLLDKNSIENTEQFMHPVQDTGKGTD